MSSPMKRPYLTTLSLTPENQETPIHFINGTVDDQLFFRRNHFSYPPISNLNYWLPIKGFVLSPQWVSLRDLMKMPSKTVKAVLECAGDKRRYFEPKVFGEQWGKGAISQGYWKGVPLRVLLEQAGIREGAKEVVVEGHDFGKRTDTDSIHSFTRSIPIDKALHQDTIVAYEYNGRPLTFKHGFPLRLIVPQWYAMASVKWIRQIRVIESSFEGPFQTVDYVYYPNKENTEGAFPVTTMNVNSTIQKPLDMAVLDTGKHKIEGIAWTGGGYITKVEISTNNGENWSETKFSSDTENGYGWVKWVYQWLAAKKGEYTILAKATDSTNRVQPDTPFWNRKGYGYNAIEKIKVKIE
ncbi:sulfite oxidase [Pseudalkalibacillus salsuginis]|uniref:sulfite oxidase n=1 Tax=Pseudalkalibacillus salsuginis TaxID=2910972 RepID=UPI001F1D26AD|nr:sulfite oxidase [Pseudalkalibacillus salsuginis]MCF6408947.1 sulfite oxidase [Pseudalkalibacillus salsuginis]